MSSVICQKNLKRYPRCFENIALLFKINACGFVNFVASLPGSGRGKRKLKHKRKLNENENGRRTLRYLAV